MRRRGQFKGWAGLQRKKIHVAWPVLCRVEIEQCRSNLKAVLGRLGHHGEQDVLLLALQSAISAVKEVEEALDQAYGE